MWVDETESSANREFRVQVDAHRDNVAFAWPIRVPGVRSAASGLLGTTFTGRAARGGISDRNAGPKHLGDGTCIEHSMFLAMALAVLVLLSLTLSMNPCPGIPARARS